MVFKLIHNVINVLVNLNKSLIVLNMMLAHFYVKIVILILFVLIKIFIKEIHNVHIAKTQTC